MDSFKHLQESRHPDPRSDIVRFGIGEILLIYFLNFQYVRVLTAKFQETVTKFFRLEFQQHKLTVSISFPRPAKDPVQMADGREDVELIERGFLSLERNTKAIFGHPGA